MHIASAYKKYEIQDEGMTESGYHEREKFIKATHVNITIQQYIINFIYTCGRLPEKAYAQQAGHHAHVKPLHTHP